MDIWYYERDGQQIGPFRLSDLQQLAGTGLIRPETMLVRFRVTTSPGTGLIRPKIPTDSGERVTAADVLDFGRLRSPAVLQETESSTPVTAAGDDQPLPPPAPPATEGASEAAVATLPPPPPPPPPAPSATPFPREQQPPKPWNPRAIAWLGLLFSPVWAGIMAGLNGRRLQSAGSLWGPVLIGVGSAVLDILVEIFLFESYLFSLLLYLGALWLLWAMYLQPQVAMYDRQPARGRQIGSWIVPAIAGAPAALLVLLVFVLYPLLPPEPVEVCRKLVAADSLEEAKECCTASLWPALTALDSLEGDDGVVDSFELTAEEAAPAGITEYLVAWRGSWREGGGSHPMEGVFHLVEVDSHWKVEEWYITAYDGQQAAQPVQMSKAYRGIVAAALQQHRPPASPLKSGSDSTSGDFNTTALTWSCSNFRFRRKDRSGGSTFTDETGSRGHGRLADARTG